MTQNRCPEHDIPLTNNQTLCPKCLWDVERDLGDMPSLLEQLDITLSRQDRLGGAGGTTDPDDPACPRCAGVGRTEHGRCTTCHGEGNLPATLHIQRLAFNSNASDVRIDLDATLAGWTHELHQPDEHPVTPTTTGYSRWLLNHRDRIATSEHGPQLRDEISYAVDQVRRAVDRPPSRVYAGPCLTPGPDGQCREDLYAKLGADTVTCRTCDTTHDLNDRRAWLLAEAEDQLETATHIAQALSTLGQHVNATRIRKWAERGRIAPHGVNLRGDPTYRVGDVIDLLAAERERESSRRSA